MKKSVSSVLAERTKQRRAVISPRIKVKYVKFSPEEMAYDAPDDVSGGKWRRAYRNVVILDPDVARVFKDAPAVNKALRKLIEAMPGAPQRNRKSA